MDQDKSLATFFTEAINRVSMPATGSDEMKKSRATSVLDIHRAKKRMLFGSGMGCYRGAPGAVRAVAIDYIGPILSSASVYQVVFTKYSQVLYNTLGSLT